MAVNATVSQFDVGNALFSGKAGVWNWAVPMGSTRVFADFTPLATGAEMYVACAVSGGDSMGAGPPAGGLALAIPASIAAGQEVVVNVQAVGGEMISPPLSLAAFDTGKSGPTGCVVRRSDSVGHAQAFRLTFNDPGRYVVWAKTGDHTGRAEITVEP